MPGKLRAPVSESLEDALGRRGSPALDHAWEDTIRLDALSRLVDAIGAQATKRLAFHDGAQPPWSSGARFYERRCGGCGWKRLRHRHRCRDGSRKELVLRDD